MEGRIGVDDPQNRWYNVLQRLLSQAHPDTCFPIINSAVGGESTREVMSRFDRDILPYRPDLCLLMVGGNNHDCLNPSRILAEGELLTLLDSFASKLPERTRPVGVVLNPVIDDWHFATKHPAYREYLASFGGSLDASLNPGRELARSFYRRHDWPYLDLYALMSDHPAQYVLPEDGIHMNEVGHELFARKMFELMDSLL
jgi:lysophospholipase L1-like esterase